MHNFTEVDLTEAYKMLEGVNTILVTTKGSLDKQYNITPYGWFTTYDYEPVTKVLFVSDPTHQAAINAKRSGEFAICNPKSEDDPLISQAGSISDPNADKFAKFNVLSEMASHIDVKLLPENSKGMIEFKLVRTVKEGSVEIFMGEAVAAWKLV